MTGATFQELIKDAKDILLFPHIQMDGDALGSVLALYWTLRDMKKQVRILVEEAPPLHLSFLPGVDHVFVYKEGIEAQFKSVDYAIALDTADLQRLGKREPIFCQGFQTMNIDHHPTNTCYANNNYVVADAAATGEILYEIIAGMSAQMTKSIATCLYTAISSDTGGFRFSNTTCKTHEIAGKCINKGADAHEISVKLFEDVSLKRLHVLGEIIQRIELHHQGKIAFISLSKDVITRLEANEEDINGYSNLGRSIRGVEVSIFIREKEKDSLKVSMRSRKSVDLTDIATKYGGGGHQRAAGFNYVGAMEQLRELLIKEFSNRL